MRKEVQEEVSSSADLLLLQPSVYLMDSQAGKHEYPVRKEVQEVRESTLQPIVYLVDSQDGQHEYPVRKEVQEVRESTLQPIVYLMDSQDGQHEYPVRKEIQKSVLQHINCSSSQLFT